MIDHRKRLIYFAVILLAIGASFLGGLRVGQNGFSNTSSVSLPINTNSTIDGPVDFSAFWKAWELLDEKFVPSSTTTATVTTSQERVWGAISGLVDSLKDPYTTFLPPEEEKIFTSDISGNFEGVGMEIGVSDGVLTVVAPLRGTPAFRAGIKSGDKVLKIDDTFTDKLSTEQAVRLIRGKVGTKVKLTILREGSEAPLEITVTRAVVDIPTIDSESRANGVFIIRLYNFSAVSPNLFRDALRKFVKTGSNKLVLDLRGNPGGFLEASVDMASWFLPTGEVVVREEHRQGGEQTVYRSRGYDIFDKNLKMAILIDQGSASAAEILAGALSEHGVATLIGAKSFGKGSVQELVKLTPDSSLKITIARWLTPDGFSISENGLKPEIEVKITSDDAKKGIDPQLNAAIEFLLKK